MGGVIMERLDLFDGNDAFVTRESILQLFEEVDKELNGQPTIDVYVVGYSAIVLASLQILKGFL
jgi:hypothetical protein